MASDNQRENHILDTILKQLIKSDDVYNSVDDLLKQMGIFPDGDELNCYLKKLQKSHFIEEKFQVSKDGQKEPSDPRRHKITKKGSDFIKNNSFSKLEREKDKRRKQEDHLFKLKIFKTWAWILISVPSVLFALNTIVLKFFDINIFSTIFEFLKKLISQ